jgi:hypothetical protein
MGPTRGVGTSCREPLADRRAVCGCEQKRLLSLIPAAPPEEEEEEEEEEEAGPQEISFGQRDRLARERIGFAWCIRYDPSSSAVLGPAASQLRRLKLRQLVAVLELWYASWCKPLFRLAWQMWLS